MGLGNNRDFISTEQRVRKNLKAHAEHMDALVSKGWTREAASREAYRVVMQKKTTKEGR